MELREALTQITRDPSATGADGGFPGLPGDAGGVFGRGGAAGGFDPGGDDRGPGRAGRRYLSLWIGAAVVSGSAAGLEMMVRARNASSPMTREMTWLALEQFCPSIVAGALLTIVLVRAVPESLWMLPGLWQIVFSLGIFASCRLLPRATFWVAVFYLVAGLAVLSLARGDTVLSPWAMALPFGAGQLLAAAVLYSTLERDHAAE